jgi:hypothetical protein
MKYLFIITVSLLLASCGGADTAETNSTDNTDSTDVAVNNSEIADEEEVVVEEEVKIDPIKAGNWYCYDYTDMKGTPHWKEDIEPYGVKTYYLIDNVTDKGRYNKLHHSESFVFYSKKNIYEWSFSPGNIENNDMENVMKNNLITPDGINTIHPKKFLDNSKIAIMKQRGYGKVIVDENGNSDIDLVLDPERYLWWEITKGIVVKDEEY